MREVPWPWPSDDDMMRLVDRSSGQFIYASAVLKHVGEENSPVERLQNLLSNVGDSRNSGFWEELDEMYTQILKKVGDIQKTRSVLAGLLLVRSDAYLHEILSILFEIPSSGRYAALKSLHSVLDIRKNQERSGTNTYYSVDIHHKSFTEFLRRAPKVSS
jgi:hypothetical protein